MFCMKLSLFIFTALLLLFSPAVAHAYLDDLDALLAAHVKPIRKDTIHYNAVNYDGWNRDKRHARVRKKIQKMDVSAFKTDEEKKAFWINAYNFFTVDLIVQKGERDSIKDLSGTESVWDRYPWSVGGEALTLNDIKNKKLIPLNDSRIHFALSCAAKSCLDLRMEVYRPQKIDKQLSDQVQKMLQNKSKGFDVVQGNNIIRVTEMMELEKNSFNKGNVRSWLQPFFPLYINAQTQITFFDFDWSLNSP